MNVPTSPEIDRFLDLLDGVKADGSGWSARCPCRSDDQNPSLHVGQGRDGRVLVTCHRGDGCSVGEICTAMGIDMGSLFPPDPDRPERNDGSINRPANKPVSKPKPVPRPAAPGTAAPKADLRLVEIYDYRDDDGTLLYQKLRYVDTDTGKKTFRHRRPDPTGAKPWLFSLDDTKRVLYRQPEIVAFRANPSGFIWLVEGEKDVNTLVERGEHATTMTDGAGKWRPEYTATLAGLNVVICADHDDIGIAHAHTVAGQLAAAGCTVAAVMPPAPYKDVTDFLDAGGDLLDLVDLPPRTPATDAPQIDAEAPEPDENTDTPDDNFRTALDALAGLAANDTLTDRQRFARAHAVLDQLQTDTPIDTGRLVSWSAFFDETDVAYDWVIPGVLERQDRVMIVAAEGVGKALAVDTPIPTPTGWTTMGDIAVGDTVYGMDGQPCRVVDATNVMNDRPCFTVSFSDGSSIVADANHQWFTETLNEREKHRPGGVRTTTEIRDTLVSNRSNRAVNHAIPTCDPLDGPETDLPIPAYTLGAWLGDGSSWHASISSDDPQILARIEMDGFPVTPHAAKQHYGILGLRPLLRTTGLLRSKHIPALYQRASFKQRLALLQGLMDTDGTVDRRGTCEFSVVDAILAADIHELLLGLGIKVTMRTGAAKLYGKDCGIRYRLSFRTALPVFGLDRKAERIPTALPTKRANYRYIVAVTPIDSVPMRCIQVDSADHLYLAGRSMIPTHNSVLGRQVAISVAHGLHPFTRQPIPKMRTLVVDLENPDRIIRRVTRNTWRVARAMVRDPDPAVAELLIKPSGMNLLNPIERAGFESVVERVRPDLIVFGPIYKSFLDPGGRTSEAVTVEVVRYFDYLRTHYNCALWLEHHAPLGNALSGRDLRPFGSAVWQRWPEFGLTLALDPTATEKYTYDVGDFRGRREDRHWPSKMKRGSVDDLPFHILEYTTDGN